MSRDRAQWVAGESLEALKGAWRSYHGLWVNHPDRNETASSKLEQLRRAESLGFTIPETVVTNDGDVVRALAERWGFPIVCKPLKSGRLTFDQREHLFFTSPVTDADLGQFPSSTSEPYLFQELIRKRHELRVTIIGDRTFAVRLDSQARCESRIDWRRGDQTKLRHTPVDLLPEIEQLCTQLVHGYGLAFGAIDLAVDLEGRHVFFELNPNGQWAWIEQITGLPMRAALADLLAGHSSYNAVS